MDFPCLRMTLNFQTRWSFPFDQGFWDISTWHASSGNERSVPWFEVDLRFFNSSEWNYRWHIRVVHWGMFHTVTPVTLQLIYFSYIRIINLYQTMVHSLLSNIYIKCYTGPPMWFGFQPFPVLNQLSPVGIRDRTGRHYPFIFVKGD